MQSNKPRSARILAKETPFPEQTDFLSDQRHADSFRDVIQTVLQEHVTTSGAHNVYNEVQGNVYSPTAPDGHIIDTPNGQIRMIVRKRPMSNGKKGEQEGYHEVTETIVEPVDHSVKETEICLGGYSVNTPAYYQDYFPYALTGKRFVFINLLGGGTHEYENRNLNLSWWGGQADLEEAYYPESGSHIAELIREYAQEGQSITLTGESTGGLVLANVLANKQYLPTNLVAKINRVVLDAPVATGRLPFGNWGTLRTTLTALRSGQFGAAFGTESTLHPPLLGRLMMSDLYKESQTGDSAARRIIEGVAESCFKATGIFPQMALKFSSHDPMVDVLTSTDAEDGRRAAALREIDFNIFYRPGDRTLPQKKILAMAERWAACGLNVVLAPGEIHPNSHMDLPGMTYRQVWLQHGVNGRLQPFNARETAVNLPISD